VKALLHFNASPALQQRFLGAAPPWLRFAFAGDSDDKALSLELADADVLLHVLAPVSAQMLAVAPRLKLIQKIGVGVNTIDLVAARERSIHVANMPGSNSQAVCECALALMLAVLRKMIPLDSATRRGEGWAQPPESMDAVGELCGRTVGLVGYGEVPRRLAPALQVLGARVVFHARRRVEGAAGEQVTLAALLAMSDIVSLHVPLTEDTRRFIDDAAFRAMRPGSILINTARGALVDEAALCRALLSGHLRGAGLDVFDREPAPVGNALFAMSNVVVTPHVAWLTAETLARSLDVIVENCTRLHDGRPLLNQIGP
jgi:phosphoglycerate dehydrogenase-like enzyme